MADYSIPKRTLSEFPKTTRKPTGEIVEQFEQIHDNYMQELKLVYKEGYDAFKGGVAKISCPYLITDKFNEWNRGWNIAEIQSRHSSNE